MLILRSFIVLVSHFDIEKFYYSNLVSHFDIEKLYYSNLVSHFDIEKFYCSCFTFLY